MENTSKKIVFISSMGGHLKELLALKPTMLEFDSYLITEKTDITISLENDEFLNNNNIPVYFLEYGTRKDGIKYIFKFLKNIYLSFKYFFKIKPDVVITTGTHTAVPMCYIARIFGKRVISIETMANINKKTLSGKILSLIFPEKIVQWESMKKVYKNAKYFDGGVF